MEIRAATIADLDRFIEIDGTIDSPRYLHVERSGDGLNTSWKLDERPLRSKLIDSNTLDDERRFAVRQVISGIEEGISLAIEIEDELTAIAVAKIDPGPNVLALIDLRVDYDLRRQGLGSALLFQLIAATRERGLRALTAQTLTNNLPACRFFAKAAFELSGLDTHRNSNHDLVKEAVSLFWYAPMD